MPPSEDLEYIPVFLLCRVFVPISYTREQINALAWEYQARGFYVWIAIDDEGPFITQHLEIYAPSLKI